MSCIHLVIYILIYCQMSEGILSEKKEDYVEDFNVTIGDTNYSVVELPGSETKLVADERRKLLGHVDLRTLGKSHVERCIYLAYHGMEAAGPEYVKLKIEVQRLGNTATILCDKLAVTVSQFKSVSTTILTDLQWTYKYLRNGCGSEDLALETLSSVSDLAGQMAKAAEEFHESFNEEVRKVEKVLEKMQETEADNELSARQKEKDLKNLKKRIERGEQQKMTAQENKEAADQKYFISELEEKEAINNLNNKRGVASSTDLIQFGYDLIWNMAVGKQNLMRQESQYNALKERANDALHMKMEREHEEKQAFNDMNELYIDLETSEREVKLAKFSAEALQEAIYSLKSLTAAMMQAAFFWKQMQEHCKSLSDSKLEDTVAKRCEHRDEKRLKLWASLPFKRQVVRFNAGWVALDDICGKYVRAIEETEKESYKYMKNEQIKREFEAKKNIPSIAARFQEDFQDACDKGNSKCR